MMTALAFAFISTFWKPETFHRCDTQYNSWKMKKYGALDSNSNNDKDDVTNSQSILS